MTLLALTPEQKKFTMALCAEHLDEAAFLYAMCQNTLLGSAAPWANAQEFENRLCAHLSALAREGDLALDTCQTRTGSTDPGDLYVAARIFCQNNRPDLIGKIFAELAPDNEKKVEALANALIDEAPGHLELVLDVLVAGSAHPRILAKVAGDARLNTTWSLLEPLQQESPEILALVLRLAGRIYHRKAVPLLLQSLAHDKENVQTEAALALLRLGNRQEVIDHCQSTQRPMLALALGGGKSELALFMQLAESGLVSREILLGLGLLGDVAALPVLIGGLDREELSESAAQALELLTGAGIEEHIFIPEELDKKELFPDELEKIEREGSLYPPGEEPGYTVVRISQKPDSWRKWLDNNNQRFVPGVRYRNGKPCSPECLVENMQSATLPRFLRQLAYEEMVIRYQKDFPFETDRPASFQKRAIGQYQAWTKSTENSYQKGQYYFAGLLLR